MRKSLGRAANSLDQVVTASTPVEQTPPTHWLMSYVAPTDSNVATYQAVTAGSLPPLPPGVVWGVDRVIGAAGAMAASDGAVFHVYSAAGQIEPVDHVAAVLQSEGLQYVPDPPL